MEGERGSLQGISLKNRGRADIGKKRRRNPPGEPEARGKRVKKSCFEWGGRLGGGGG